MCLHVIRQSSREQLVDGDDDRGWGSDDRYDDAELDGPEVTALRREQQVLVRRALADLPDRHRELMELLIASPPVSYREISVRLGIPVGSIGPTRARILTRLREALAPVGLHDLVLS